MNISIPPAISSMGPTLLEFFEAMVFKLNVNSHKKALSDSDIDGLLERMQEEIAEFREQRLVNANDPNILAELADISNFSFLLYAFLRAKGVRTDREEFIEQYLDIRPEEGRVYCKKTRSGSRYRVGDEIKGYGTPVRIRTQHAMSGSNISLLRRDLIWWKVHGFWPPIGLAYRSVSEKLTLWGPTLDRIDNLLILRDDIPGSRTKLPFVSQYCPKGRENNKNYGRWVYQRRYKFKLVRVGYWDSPEEAAREGIKVWKEKTRDV